MSIKPVTTSIRVRPAMKQHGPGVPMIVKIAPLGAVIESWCVYHIRFDGFGDGPTHWRHHPGNTHVHGLQRDLHYYGIHLTRRPTLLMPYYTQSVLLATDRNSGPSACNHKTVDEKVRSSFFLSPFPLFFLLLFQRGSHSVPPAGLKLDGW